MQRSFINYAPLADLQHFAALGQLEADAFASGVAEGDGAVIIGDCGGDHVLQFGLVAGGHEYHVGQAAEIGDIEGSGVGLAVGAD